MFFVIINLVIIMQRYFAKGFNNNIFTLDLKDIHHLKNVVKYQPKEYVEIVYDNNLYIGVVNDDYTISSNELINQLVNSDNVVIGCSLIKEQKWNYLLQKATECNVKGIIPLNTDHSIIKIKPSDRPKKIQRWNNIIKSASEQSKRIEIPVIYDIINMSEIKISEYDYCFIMDASGVPLKKVLMPINNNAKILILFGPEGGFSSSELETMVKKGAVIVNIGDTIYRAETAPIVALSMIKYHFME